MLGLADEQLTETPPLIPLTDLDSLYTYLMAARPARTAAATLGAPVVVSHPLHFECDGVSHIGDALAFSYSTLDVLVMACSPRLAPEGKWGVVMVRGAASQWSTCTKMVKLNDKLHRMHGISISRAAREDLALCLMLLGAAIVGRWFPPDTRPDEL